MPKGCEINAVVLGVLYRVSNLPNAVRKFSPAWLLLETAADPDIIATAPPDDPETAPPLAAANSVSTSNAA